MTKYRHDIFATLRAIDNRNFDYINETNAKGFAAPVVMRWASSTTQHTEYHLIAINERANARHYATYQHPELQYRLMASCGTGIEQRHQWIPQQKSDKAQKRIDFIKRYWPDARDYEVEIILKKFRDPDTLNDFLCGTGMQNDEIKNIKSLF